MKRSLYGTVLLLTFASALLAASAGSVRGKIVGPDNHRMPGVVVTLRNVVTGFHQDVPTGTDGTSTFFSVPYNPYQLHVEVQRLAPVAQSIGMRSAAHSHGEYVIDGRRS